MYKQFRKKITFIIVFFIILCSSFFKQPSYAVTDDDGPDVTDESIDWQLTCYGGESLGGTGFTENDFTTNEKYGWCEYEKDGVTYVVLAAATHELLNSGEIGAVRHDYIHYFSYYDTIQFKFVDESFDSNVYNGIILDSCGASMYPPAYGHADNVQILDVYFKASTYSEQISGQHVKVTMDGSFSSSAGTSSTEVKKNFFIDLFAALFKLLGDVIQLTIGNLAVGEKDAEVTYTSSAIRADEDLQKEIQVSDAGESTQSNTQKTIDISNTIDNEKGESETVFSSSTEIPVIPVDFYSASIDKFQMLDIDFFDTSNDNSNKFWEVVADTVSFISHSVMYISAALLLTMLILRSILLVKSSLGDDPGGAARSRKIIDNWVKSIILISGVYIIMTLMMYFYQNILTIVLNENDSNYLIRANVENVYSFNTNQIGYFRYMTLQTNSISAFKYSILYFLQALINGIWFLFMLARMLIIGGLIIVAPLTAVMTMFEKIPKKGFSLTNILQFKNWLTTYLLWLWIPIVVVMIYRIVLYIG